MTVDKPTCVEMTRDKFGICDEDYAIEVLMVLVLVERGRLLRPKMASGGKGVLSVILRER